MRTLGVWKHLMPKHQIPPSYDVFNNCLDSNLCQQPLPQGMGHRGCVRNMYMCCYTDWVWTLVTTISCRLMQSNGSLTCPFAGGVTDGVHNEVVDIFITLRWMTKMTGMTRSLKSRPWEWLAGVYGNLVIVVTLVMKDGKGGRISPP